MGYQKNGKKGKNQEGGVWDKNKDAGLISAHGGIITDSFVVIPEGISIRPLATLGEAFIVNDLKNDLDELETKKLRKITFDSNVYDEKRGHVYKTGDVIPDMTLRFRLIWENEKGMGSNEVRYAVTGVATERKIDTTIRESNKSQLNSGVKKDSMKSHDPIIDIEWNDRLSLGRVLKKIKNKKKEGDYWLLACRKGDIVRAEKECGLQPLRKKLKTSNIDIFTNLRDKINSLYDNPDQISSRVSQLKNNRKLLSEFIKIYATFCKLKISKDNDYTIDSTLLCEINEISFKKYVKVSTLNRFKSNILFEGWWKKFNLYRRSLLKKKKVKQPSKKKRKTEKAGFAFKL